MRTLIYNKDCLEGMKKIPSNIVDLVVTDPPYGLSNAKSSKNILKEAIGTFTNIIFPDFNEGEIQVTQYSELIRILFQSSDLRGFKSGSIGVESWIGVPESAINLNYDIKIRQIEITATDKSTSNRTTNEELMGKGDFIESEFIGDFVLDFGDTTNFSYSDSLSCDLSQLSSGFFTTHISSICTSSFPGLQTGKSSVFSRDDFVKDIRLSDDTGGYTETPRSVLTSWRTKGQFMLRFDLGGGTAELFLTDRTNQDDSFSKKQCPSLIRTFTGASCLSSMFESIRVSFICNIANRTYSFYFHLWLPPKFLNIIAQLTKTRKGFMGKEWDGQVPPLEIWKECLRVLKEGAFAFVMCIPRQDCLSKMILLLEEAGFKIDYTSIYWTYACLSEDTEILTKNGWERLQKSTKCGIIDVEQFFAQKEIMIYDTNSGTYKWEVPIQWNIYNIEDTCYQIKSDTTEQIVSGGHRVAIEQDGKIIFQFAKDLRQKVCVPYMENLQRVWKNLSYKSSKNKSRSETQINSQVLQSTMQRQRESQIQKCSKQKIGYRWSYLVKRAQAKTTGVYDGEQKLGMERWSNILQNAWQLLKSQIYSLSKRIFVYVPERWLCYGAQAISSTGIRSSIVETGSSASFRSRSKKQSNRQSHPLHIQQRPQTSRTWSSYQTTLATVKKVFYSGIVFCPTVSTGCFVARRNGKIFLTGNSGFPKAANVGKLIDRGMGMSREIVGKRKEQGMSRMNKDLKNQSYRPNEYQQESEFIDISAPASPQAQALDGSYVGFQPKPALEIILVVQKPITTKYRRSDLYMILDKQQDYWYTAKTVVTDKNKEQLEQKWDIEFEKGDVIERRIALNPDLEDEVIVNRQILPESAEKTFPFLITPKPSKREKNEGLEELPEKQMYKCDNSAESLEIFGTTDGGRKPRQNIHPTVKPVKLMSWLITLGSKEGDLVLDPFMGSGSTGIAAQLLDRYFIGFELEKEYFEIAKLRLKRKKEDD